MDQTHKRQSSPRDLTDSLPQEKSHVDFITISFSNIRNNVASQCKIGPGGIQFSSSKTRSNL